MTTMFKQKVRCSVCGEESEHLAIGSTNAFGSPDLDLRPPEMQRSTMPHWVQECPKCGYVACVISDKCPVSAEFLKSEEYLSCGRISFESRLAKKTLILETKRDRENLMLISADVLRRAGKFQVLIDDYSSLRFKGRSQEEREAMNKILAFQLEKAKQQDTSCYTVEEVLS